MTYRTPQDELLGCLSLLEEEKVERIYVIDNSPTDEIRSLVQEFRTVEYIHRPDNPGYGAAHNVAIRDVLSRGVEYHLVLNSDITFERGTLAAIIEMMDRRPETGLLQPRIIYPDGREQYSSRLLPSPLDLIGKRFLPHRFLSRRLNRYMLTDRPEREELNIPYHQGSFMFFRVAALRKIGLFDERFFMYPEDIDISRRVHEHISTSGDGFSIKKEKNSTADAWRRLPPHQDAEPSAIPADRISVTIVLVGGRRTTVSGI